MRKGYRNPASMAKMVATRIARTAIRFQEGKVVERPVLRRYIIERDGYKCNLCPTSDTWNGLPIVLQVDHIDGNSANNMPANLRLLCPNCHSQTPTWGARNKGSGRKARGISLG